MEATTCASCGAEIPASFRLCGECGTPLEGAAAVEELQRYATVVTSDLKGSTALGERLDPETLREVLTLYFDEMQAVFRSHGGTIEKIIGDAIVAVFGLPIRHDDDALRAVEAASESQRVLAVLNDRLEERWGVRLVVRTGVATGIVVFGAANEGQHVLTGDTIQAATAMEQNAPALEVLISGSTYDAVADSVDAERADDVTPKGWLSAIPAYRLLSVAPRDRAAAAGPGGLDPDAADGQQRCPTCGEANPESFRLCGMCGATLAPLETVSESRRTVTVVFADPKPVTADGSPPSAEALRDVMSGYFEVMKRALEAHGGTVEKFIGDAVMAVFGLPVRHEDDALRAIRGAAAMQDALPDLNEGFRREWGIELGNHIGVNTGEVIAGDASTGQRLVTGDTVNTAARLEQAAAAREIVIGELTYRLARGEVEVEAIPPLTLKGKAEPVPAYRLVRVAQRPAERADPTTPFVGREEELTRLETTLVEVSATRSCQLVTVIGDAGVGKSRLVREFAGRASHRDLSQVLRGRCLPYGDGVTFWPIYEIVRGAAAISDEDPRETALAKITEIATRSLSAEDDPAMVVERVAAAIGLSTTAFPVPELFWGIRKLLEAIASRRPLVAIVDDIHVAAPTFLELLDHLLESVHGSPILLLATARRELLESRSEWAEAHEYDHMILDPLSAEDADGIVARLFQGLEGPVRERITAAAEGNPLYVEQIAAMLVDSGAIRQETDGWVAATSSGDIEIPPTIEALVAARLDSLRSEERQVVDPASVIGLGFAVDAVANLVTQAAAPDVPDRLATLTAKQLVRPAASSDPDFYRFGHAVIKDAAYRSLLKRTRAELHQKFVEWAEPINRERGRELEFEEILGYHLEQAYRYRSDLGPRDQATVALGARASDKLASAGRRALGRGDFPAASSLLQRAMALREADDPERLALAPDLGMALMELGEFHDAMEVLRDAVQVASLGDDPRLAARARLVIRYVEHYSGESDDWSEVTAREIDEVLPILERTRDEPGQTLAWRLRSGLYGTAGRWADVAQAAEQVVIHARRANDERAATRASLSLATASLYGPTPAPQAIAQIEGILDRPTTDQLATVLIKVQLAQLVAMQGDIDRARALYAGARERLADLRADVAAARTSIVTSRVELLAGDLIAAEAQLRLDYEHLTALGERNFRFTVAGLLARVLVQRGQLEEAETFASIVRDQAPQGDADAQALWRSTLARVLAHRSMFREAVALAEEAVLIRREADAPTDLADAVEDLAEVRRAAGRQAAYAAAIEEAAILADEKGDRITAERLRRQLEPSAT